MECGTGERRWKLLKTTGGGVQRLLTFDCDLNILELDGETERLCATLQRSHIDQLFDGLLEIVNTEHVRLREFALVFLAQGTQDADVLQFDTSGFALSELL